MRVYVSTTKEAAAIGGALLAKWARWKMSNSGSFEDMTGGLMPGMTCVAEPRPEIAKVYEQFLEVYDACERQVVQRGQGHLKKEHSIKVWLMVSYWFRFWGFATVNWVMSELRDSYMLVRAGLPNLPWDKKFKILLMFLLLYLVNLFRITRYLSSHYLKSSYVVFLFVCLIVLYLSFFLLIIKFEFLV